MNLYQFSTIGMHAEPRQRLHHCRHGRFSMHVDVAAFVFLVTGLLVLGLVGHAFAADIEAGKAKAAACMACHGQTGVSTRADVPNLAGQKVQYLTNQLNAFRAGNRTNPFMNAMASQLSDTDITNLAAFFSSLQEGTAAAMSPVPEAIVKTRLTFPDNFPQAFTHYTTINFPKKNQVRYYYANDVALTAAQRGNSLPDGSVVFVEIFKAKLDANQQAMMGSDGFFEKDTLLAFTAMEHQKGWGAGFPDLMRNDDWNYAVFKADTTLKTGVNQARCLVCHKPHAESSYLFTLKQLTAKAKMVK